MGVAGGVKERRLQMHIRLELTPHGVVLGEELCDTR